MHLHILFCPSESVAPNGSQLPTAQLALSLDDGEQHLCAGFVQTEIERYAEELEEAAPPREDESEDEDSGVDHTDDEATKAKGKKKGKGKQSKQDATGEDLSFRKLGLVLTLNSSSSHNVIRSTRERICLHWRHGHFLACDQSWCHPLPTCGYPPHPLRETRTRFRPMR